MEYETLINLKFKRTEGSVDLTKSGWSSVIINEINNREETIDYSSAGRFDNGESAYFDGEFSVINKVTGKNLELDLNEEDFTFALWMNCDFTAMTMKQYLLCGNNQNKTSNNAIYLQPVKDAMNMVVTSTTGKEVVIPFNSGFINNYSAKWTWIRVTKSKDEKVIKLWVNNTKVGEAGNISSSFKLTFNNNESCIGKGYDIDFLYYPRLKGYLDDVVLVKGLAYTEKSTPDTYFLNIVDPSLLEDSDNAWIEPEREYSQYDSITDTIEWKRFNTKEEIDKRQSALIPYIVDQIWEQSTINLDTWIKPVLTNPYRIGDKVIYNVNEIYNNTIDFNTNYPTTDGKNGWELIHYSLSKINDWTEPHKFYNYMDKVLYNKRVYQSQKNYNTTLPAAWTILTALTNTEKEILSDDYYKWDSSKTYAKKDKVNHDGKFYISVLDNNTGYIPGDISSWKEVGGSTNYVVEWVQPTSYNVGDIVRYNGKYYHCNINYNILTPGNHHVEWTEVKTWNQPIYKNTYSHGDKVFYKGKTYECSLKDSYGNYIYHNYSVAAPDEIVNKSYYKALAIITPTEDNYYDPRNKLSIFWKEIPVSEIGDTSKYTEWVKGTVYSTGDLVVTTDYDWKQIYISEGYFQNKTFTIDRDNETIKIKFYDAWDNHFLNNESSRIYYKKNFLAAFNANEVDGYVLMLNNRFIKWADIEIIRSDRFVTLSVNKPASYVIKSLLLIRLPCKVIYSETGYMPDNGIKLFGFNSDGAFGNEINIYTTNNKIRELSYTEKKFDNFYIDTNLEHKITKSNLFLFDEDGKWVDRENYTISPANLFTYIPVDGKEYTLYCIWDDTENPNEDNLEAIPNDTRVREYVTDFNNGINSKDFIIDTQQLAKEFNYDVIRHTIYNDYDENIEQSMNSIFNYNKNKFDSVYEEIRPVNIVEYSESSMNALKRDIRVTITEENLGLLLHSYIVDGISLIELCNENKDKYIGKTVVMKLRQYLSVALTKDNINAYLNRVAIVDSENVVITNSNKNNLIGKTVKFNTSNLFTENTVKDYDSIIMSRDIYDKMDYKNNTHVILFKRGMLPEWYNTIQYTNDKFYFSDIPRASNKTIYIDNYKKQYIQVIGKSGEYYTGNSNRSFEVEDGTDFTSNFDTSVIPNDGYTAGIITELPGIVTDDAWIRASDATINFYTVTVVPSAHQHIKTNIISNGEDYDLSTLESLTYTDTSFKVPYNTVIHAALSSDKGYTASKLNYESVIVKNNITIYANGGDATANDYTISLINAYKDIADLTADYKDKTYRDTTINAKFSETFTVNTELLNDRYRLTGINYSADAVSVNENGSYTLLDNAVFTLNPPVDNAFRFFINSNSDMNITATNMGIMNKEVASCKAGEDMQIINRDIVTINIKPKSSYNAASSLLLEGKVRKLVRPTIEDNQGELNYTITTDESDVLLSVTDTKIRWVAINIPQTTNQTITVTYTSPVDGSINVTTESVMVPYGSTYTVAVTPDPGYYAGVLTPTSGTATENVTISCTEAERIRYKVTISCSAGQTITISPALNSDGTYFWGTKWTATLKAWKGFKAGTFTTASSGTCYSNMTVSASAASITDDLIGVIMYKQNGMQFDAGVGPGGQGHYEDAFRIAQSYLDNYPANKARWVRGVNGGSYYNEYSYDYTYWQAIKITCATHDPSIKVDVKWTDGWNKWGGFSCRITDIDSWTKDVRLVVSGGDKGGEQRGWLTITVTATGVNSWKFSNFFEGRSD